MNFRCISVIPKKKKCPIVISICQTGGQKWGSEKRNGLQKNFKKFLLYFHFSEKT